MENEQKNTRREKERDRGEERNLSVKGAARIEQQKNIEPISLDEPKVGPAKRIQRFALTQN